MKPARALQDTIADTAAEVLPFVGSKQTLRDAYKRARKKAFPTPKTPASFDEFVIQSPRCKTIDGDQFLITRSSIGKKSRHCLVVRMRLEPVRHCLAVRIRHQPVRHYLMVRIHRSWWIHGCVYNAMGTGHAGWLKSLGSWWNVQKLADSFPTNLHYSRIRGSGRRREDLSTGLRPVVKEKRKALQALFQGKFRHCLVARMRREPFRHYLMVRILLFRLSKTNFLAGRLKLK